MMPAAWARKTTTASQIPAGPVPRVAATPRTSAAIATAPGGRAAQEPQSVRTADFERNGHHCDEDGDVHDVLLDQERRSPGRTGGDRPPGRRGPSGRPRESSAEAIPVSTNGSPSSSALTTVLPKSGVATSTAAVAAGSTTALGVARGPAARRPMTPASRDGQDHGHQPMTRSASAPPSQSAIANIPMSSGGRSTQ